MDSVRNEGAFDGPSRLGNAVSRLIRHRGLAERSRHHQLAAEWKKAVGPELAARSSVRRLRGGILEVAVSNGAALEQLRGFLHQTVLKDMQQAMPDSEIRDIRYVRQSAGK